MTMENQILRGRVLGEARFHASLPAVAGFELEEPDETRGYLEFFIAHSLPTLSLYGTGIHPGVLARSYRSIIDKPLNLEHLMRANDPEKKQHDRIIGAIKAAQYDLRESRGEAVPKAAAGAARIHGVAALFKAAQGVDKLIGQHQGGRHEWTVSMEINYRYEDSGFLVADPELVLADGHKPETPADLRAHGWSYVPMAEAEDGLLDTYDFKELRMASKKEIAAWPGFQHVGQWKRRGVPAVETYLVKGGLAGKVNFKGVGVVQYGAEPTAEIAQMLAAWKPAGELTEGVEGQVLGVLNEFVDRIKGELRIED